MAVTSRELHWSGASGSRGKDGAREYNAVYRCFTNDAADQAATIIAYFESNGPFIGTSYAYGNDVDSAAYCDKITPKREDRSSNIWVVEVHYTEADEEDRDKDEDGNPTEDPLEFYDDVQVSFAQFTRPVEKAWLRTQLPQRALDSEGPVVNSANVPFDPPPERDDSRQVVRVICNTSEWDDADYEDYIDSVNSGGITITKRFVNYSARWLDLTAKLQNVSGSFRIKNDIKYWEVTHQVEIRKDRWRAQILDRGFHADGRIGQPDGKGGMIGFGPDGTALDNTQFPGPAGGVPPLRTLKDPFGEPVAVPVLLNGQGQPLAPGADPFYIEYTFYEELDWSGLTLLTRNR